MGLPIRLLALCSRPEELVAQVAAALPANAKCAVFDAVTSNTAIVLPIRELVELCHSRQGAVWSAAQEGRCISLWLSTSVWLVQLMAVVPAPAFEAPCA